MFNLRVCVLNAVGVVIPEFPFLKNNFLLFKMYRTFNKTSKISICVSKPAL